MSPPARCSRMSASGSGRATIRDPAKTWTRRCGAMCRDDGMVFDDGVGARLAADRFFLTTTTGNAGPVLDWFEEWLQTEWTELDVFCTSLTEEFANLTLVSPASRQVLAALAPQLDLAQFPFMTMREADVAGTPARIFR